ncbi:hypothetical protein J7E62_09280 [Variovorax paradoxus]|nr:hypothetical protein [Variovorax paradoxus]
MTPKKAAPAKKAAAKKGDKAKTLDSLGVEWLCDKLTAGETQTEIVKGLGIGIATLGRWIASDADRSARVREARVSAARTYAEQAETVLKGARNPFALAKAKELAHHYRWKASKSDPGSFGEKLEIEQRTQFTDLTDEQLDAKLAAIEKAKKASGDADPRPEA